MTMPQKTFYCHILFTLNNLTLVDHPPFPPDLDMNDFGYFPESNKPSKSEVYKAEDIPKGCAVSSEVSFKREAPKIFGVTAFLEQTYSFSI